MSIQAFQVGRKFFVLNTEIAYVMGFTTEVEVYQFLRYCMDKNIETLVSIQEGREPFAITVTAAVDNWFGVVPMNWMQD